MTFSDEIQMKTMIKIEAAAKTDETERKYREFLHCKTLNGVINDINMNRFGSRQVRNAWKENIDG